MRQCEPRELCGTVRKRPPPTSITLFLDQSRTFRRINDRTGCVVNTISTPTRNSRLDLSKLHQTMAARNVSHIPSAFFFDILYSNKQNRSDFGVFSCMIFIHTDEKKKLPTVVIVSPAKCIVLQSTSRLQRPEVSKKM